jgi:superfamily II DNA or RNA helicase
LAIAASLGYRTMIIVHKEFLMNQWIERIRQFCPNASIGIVQRDRMEVNCDFVIAMLHSLCLKEYTIENFESIGTLIVDEAHHICAAVFSQSMFRLCPKHIFGLSATPERKDGLTKLLHWFIGPNFFTVKRVNQSQVTVKKIDYSCDAYKQPPPTLRNGQICLAHMITELVENPHRNQMIINLIRKTHEENPTRHMLVLTDRREHCSFLQSQFPGVSGLYMGGMKEAELELSKKKTLVIGTFQQAHEGLDIETLDTVFLVTPKSNIEQSVGRILRGKAKNDPLIFDICDQWSLLCAMYRKRVQVYVASGFKIEAPPEKKRKAEEVGFLFRLTT